MLPNTLRVSHRVRHASVLPAALAVLAVLIATCLMTRVYRVYSQTSDEAAHLACGMEWWTNGTYTYETLHPPLARIAIAALPYLTGSRSFHQADMLVEGNAILHRSTRQPRVVLTLARMGNLPFFWLTCLLTFNFMRRHVGPAQACVAATLLAVCPVFLAHASLATTDAGLTAMLLWSLVRLQALLEQPSARNAVIAGISLGAALLTKFTALPDYLLAVVVLGAAWVYAARRKPVFHKEVLLVPLLAALTVWAGYRFSFHPIYPHGLAASLHAKHVSPALQYALTRIRVPAPEFLQGMASAKVNGLLGRTAYLMGHVYTGARLLFFPAGVFFKTPLATLALFAIGVYLLLNGKIRNSITCATLIAGFAVPLLVGMAGHLNIGLRHVLPLYPFLCMIAAIGAVGLFQSRAHALSGGGIAVAILLVWAVGAGVLATPDFLPYFNLAAAPFGDHILVDSDLDWGQDLYRLQQTVAQHHIQALHWVYFGDMTQPLILPAAVEPLAPEGRVTGWVAISEKPLREQPRAYGWLDPLPHTMVGRSIRLYHLP